MFTLPGHLLILGDFNIHWDKPDNPERIEFADLVEFTGSLNILHNTERRASSSSSFILHTDRLDDKDEIDDSQTIQSSR